MGKCVNTCSYNAILIKKITNSDEEIDKIPITGLPGHWTFSLQTLSSLGSPSHFFPPYCGAGESQFRFLEHFPCLHVLLQALHALHSPQFPSTVENEYFSLPDCFEEIISNIAILIKVIPN